jgi:hypothetical protein
VLVAVDLDGTIDAFPRELQSMMSALRAAGHEVEVVSGANTDTVTQSDVDAKAELLASLGCGECYDRLVVLPGPESAVAERKTAYLRSVNASMLIDNRKENVKSATDAGILALLPWGSKE